MFRRFAFIMVCIYCNEEKFVFQLFYAVFSQLLYLVYLIEYQPQNEPSENKLELFTETCIMSFVYTMLAFTNLVHDPIDRFNIGYGSIGIFFLNISVNLAVVVVGQVLDVKKKCK